MTARLGLLALILAASAALFLQAGRTRAGYFPPNSVSFPSTPAPASVIVATDERGGSAGLLPSTSSQPDLWRVGYLGNGDYQIASAGTTSGTGVFVVARNDAPNVSIAVNGQFVVGSTSVPDAILRLGCRYQPAGSAYTGYGFSFDPTLNAWSLDRFDADGAVVSLSGVQYLQVGPLIWTSHHLQMSCAGNTIAAAVDGINVGPVQDSAYQDGRPMLGVGTFTREGPSDPQGTTYAGTFDAVFSNLTLTQP